MGPGNPSPTQHLSLRTISFFALIPKYKKYVSYVLADLIYGRENADRKLKVNPGVLAEILDQVSVTFELLMSHPNSSLQLLDIRHAYLQLVHPARYHESLTTPRSGSEGICHILQDVREDWG